MERDRDNRRVYDVRIIYTYCYQYLQNTYVIPKRKKCDDDIRKELEFKV